MKKHLLAAAVAAAVAVPAMAQNVTISGRASMEVGQWETTGSTAGSASDFRNRTRVADTASRFTFAATEDLGGGLRAGVYCETGINIDSASNTGQAGTVNANTSEWCSREGRAFIGNNMAEIRLGRQNVWWTTGQLDNLSSTYTGSSIGTAFFNGTAVAAANLGTYGVRVENMVMLHANAGMGPFTGSHVYYAYMGNQGSQTAAPTPVTTGEAAVAGASPRGKVQGFKLQYSQGQVLGMIDNQSSNTGAIDRNAYKYGFGYRYAGANSASIVSVQYYTKDATTAGVKAEDNGYVLTLQYDLGGGMIAHALYSRAQDYKSGGATVANTGGSGYTVGVTRALSKRTHLYGALHSITNESGAAFGMAAGNYQSGTPAAGADTKAWGLGMIHNF